MLSTIYSSSSVDVMKLTVEKAKAAQEKFQLFTQEQIDRIIKNIAEKAYEKSEYLAKLTVEETGMGIIEHKKIKNELGSMGVYESIKDKKTVGIIRRNPKEKVTEIAYPFGVIAAICPTTNPTSTAIYKTLISLKAQNAIVVSPHPTAKKCTIEALKICHDAAIDSGAPTGLIGWIDEPTMGTTTELMKHPEIDLIVATGGGGLVKAAYSSGKPAYGVGPGNGPVYLEKSANVKKAVRMIIDSKTFDNGTLCSTEQSIVVHKNIKHIVLRELKNNGAYLVDTAEKERLERIISPEKGKLNPNIVGRSAHVIAEMAGFQVPEGTTVLIAEEEIVSKHHPFSIEKLAPIFPLYTINNEKEAHELCIKLLNNGGRGHSCSIHSNDEQAIQTFGLNMPVSRIMVNTLASIGAAGATTGLTPSLTLGCGSYGGNISSDNITVTHLFNTKRIAYGIKEMDIPTSQKNASYNKEVTSLIENTDIKNEVIKAVKSIDHSRGEIDQEIVTKIVQNIARNYLN